MFARFSFGNSGTLFGHSLGGTISPFNSTTIPQHNMPKAIANFHTGFGIPMDQSGWHLQFQDCGSKSLAIKKAPFFDFRRQSDIDIQYRTGDELVRELFHTQKLQWRRAQ